MDGTLLDLKFDNEFWLERVPAAYAIEHGLSLDASRDALYPRMRALRGTLDWYCIDFWSEELNLDIAALKYEHRHGIGLRPGATGFLSAVKRSGRQQYLLTNAHELTLDIKMEMTGIGHYFDQLISSHRFNAPKEDAAFWTRLVEATGLNLTRCLFVDDSQSVLEGARDAGVGRVLGVAQPDSSRPPNDYAGFAAFDDWQEIMPG